VRPSGSAASRASPPSGTARSGSAPPTSWRRSAGCSRPWACTRWAATTCATPSLRRSRSCRRRSGRSTGGAGGQPVPGLHVGAGAEDRRFFEPELESRVRAFLDARTLFPAELLELSDRADAEGGLASEAAERFLVLATRAFALSPEPIDQPWYDELSAVSGVAADIAGVTTSHVNHLTPRVLDIDLLYARMQQRGVTMIDEVQGPPRWDGPDVLLGRRRSAPSPSHERCAQPTARWPPASCGCASARSRHAVSP
jgi:hypothetical protein